ncbi:hypothetical protein KY332_03745 [Candidatus Woesearchaeota archaeon]|nr:hypothetical protein [Candidatus Woesearchaeota archaeon]
MSVKSKKIGSRKKKSLKSVIKSFIEHPLDFMGEIVDDIIHPEVKEDIKKHMEADEDEEPKKHIKVEKPIEDKRMQGDDSHEDLAESYDIPEDYAYKEEKETDYVLQQVKERVEGGKHTREELEEAKVKDHYAPGELLEGDYEKLRIKFLEKGKILPTGFRKYLNPTRKRIMEALSFGKYKYRKD